MSRDNDIDDQAGSASAAIARLDERLKSVQMEVHSIKQLFDKYVTRLEFLPIKLIAMGLATLVLSSVVVAIMSKVLHQ